MIRMRWFALALVCCMATTVRAQSTQDTAKKPAATKVEHKAGSKMEAKGAKVEHKGVVAEKAGAKMEKAGMAKAGEKVEHKGAVTAKTGEKMERKGKRMARKPKAKPDSTKKGS